MSSSTSSMVDAPGADRKFTKSPTPLPQDRQDFGIIPKTHSNRTLVLCFDGTGDKFDSDVRKIISNTLAYQLPHSHIVSELERRTVHITTEEGQQARTDGLLPGTLSERPYGTILTFGTEDWNWYICFETRSGILHPNCQEDIQVTGRSCRLESCKSYAVFVLICEVFHLEIYGSFCQPATSS